MAKEEKIIDLDALVPDPIQVKFGGQTITVNPPQTGQVLRLSVLAQQLDKVGEPAAIEEVVNKITEVITACIPELQGKSLNTKQLITLMGTITEMAMPEDGEQSADQGGSAPDPKA